MPTGLKRPSSLLLFLALTFSVLTIMMSVLVFISANALSKHSEQMNQSGFVRGSAQRAVKLELVGANTEEIDTQLAHITQSIVHYMRAARDPVVKARVKELYLVWEELVADLRSYRVRPSVELADDLLLSSEQVWQMSEAVTQLGINRNAERWNTFDVLFLLLLANACCIAGLFWFTWSNIRGRLENQALTDSLCGVGSRRGFDAELDRQWHLHERYREPFSLLLIDIDHFKNINDAYGHAIGDRVLKQLAELVNYSTRSTDQVFRVGGEEFAVLAPHTSKSAAHQMAENLRTEIADAEFVEVGHVSVSIGIAEAAESASAKTLYMAADKAMYHVKRTGRNGTHISGERDRGMGHLGGAQVLS